MGLREHGREREDGQQGGELAIGGRLKLSFHKRWFPRGRFAHIVIKFKPHF
jgi:hypothetical protein